MGNINVNDLMKLLANMDRKDLEKGLSQASQILNSPNGEEILKKIKNNNQNNNH